MQPPDTLDPTFARQHDVRVLFDNVRRRIELDDLFTAANRRAALVGMLGPEFFEFGTNDLPQQLLTGQQLAQLFGGLLLLAQLIKDRVDLER